jgi:hypothetical protein
MLIKSPVISFTIFSDGGPPLAFTHTDEVLVGITGVMLAVFSDRMPSASSSFGVSQMVACSLSSESTEYLRPVAPFGQSPGGRKLSKRLVEVQTMLSVVPEELVPSWV